MSENIGAKPRGWHRREIMPPPVLPDIDIEKLFSIRHWRTEQHHKPILDKLLGHYRFTPVSKRGAETYTGARIPENDFAGVSRKTIIRYYEDRDSVSAPERQVIHKAESTELATALFGSAAYLRHLALVKVLGQVNTGQFFNSTEARHAADAIEDFGLCLESPYQNQWDYDQSKKPGRAMEVRDAVVNLAPRLGTAISEFGAYAKVDPDVLRSADGVVLLDTAIEEQEYRLEAWPPRHLAVVQAFPGLRQSAEIMELRKSLDEILEIQDGLAA